MTGPALSGARVVAVCVVHELHPDDGNASGATAIDKRPVEGPTAVTSGGLAGDRQMDVEHHGGRDQAVYAYAAEDVEWWAGELGRPIAPGGFGENLRTSGLDVTGALIGERWRIGGRGGVLLEVTGPRIPCSTFQRFTGEPHWVKRFGDHGAPGAYLRVLEPGEVAAGDEVVVEHRPGHAVTVGDTFLRLQPHQARTLLERADAGELDLHRSLRREAERVLARG